MFRPLEVKALLAAALWFAAPPSHSQNATYGFGRAATPAEISAWDIDVRPDGHGVKPGRGTVAKGQEIYDAQCASCHGTFGESNDYLVLAGGVEPEDLLTGRARRLRDADVIRTVGNKLNYATTLWDYIFRSMPWTRPQSLTVDEVYAVTAYVLHLNNIVGAAFELNDRNLTTLRMPNRNGMTSAHGMASVTGKPDVQGSSCMKDCRPPARIVSEMPDYARNAHGNLAEQQRALGPLGAIDTTRYEAMSRTDADRVRARPVATTSPAAGDVSAAVDGRVLLAKFGCVACHAVDARVIGPGMKEVAARYSGGSDAAVQLARRIREGSAGNWGQIPMPAQPGVSASDATAIAYWVIAGAK